jgi:hypothetical protein
LGEATRKLGKCQVRSKTQSPCLKPAVVEIKGVPFCGPCASRQEAYFAIGELTRGKHSLRSKPLAEALERMRRERRITGGIIAPSCNWARSMNPSKKPSRRVVLLGSAYPPRRLPNRPLRPSR